MWLPPPLCAIPTNHHHCVRCPALSAVCVCWWWDWAQRRTVVARTLVWRCAWRLATTPTSHAVHACRLSPLSCPQTHPPTHTHKWHCSLHTHMACFVCLVPSTHSLTGCLTAHTPSTHTLVGVRVLIHLLSCAITHTAQAQAWRLPGCFGVVVTTTTPLVPHTHTQGLVVGAMVVVGGGRVGTVWLPRHATHSPCLPPHTPHPPPHTPWCVVCLACLATPTTTTQPHHTHTTTATVPQWWLPLVTTPSTHTPHLPHTRHTHQGQAQAWLWLLVWHHHHAGVGHSLSSLLPFLSTNPFLSLLHALTPLIPSSTTPPSHPSPVRCVWEWTDGWTTLWLSTPHTALLMGVLIGDTIQPFHPPSPLSLCFCPPPTTTPSLFSAHHTHTQRRKGEWGWTCWCCGCVMDGVGGMCGLWVVLCVGCVLHGVLIPSLCPHQTTTTLPFSSPFTIPLFCLCLCLEKGVDHKVDGVEWSVVCGMQHISHCAFIKPSPTPVCLWSFTIPFSLSNSFSSFLVLVCLDRKSEGQVWDSPCQTHCAPHPIHTTLFPSNHTPLFNEHMVDWFVMHQNTFHPSMVLCPLLMHKPFPPHSCFAIPFHHSTHQPPLLFSFSLFPFHSLSQHSCHAIIQHSFTPSMCSL